LLQFARVTRFGIGKEIGGAVYVHRNYEDRLGTVVRRAKESLPGEFEYHVVKYNYRTGAVSFVQCGDFDSSPEPTVGEIVAIDAAGKIRRRSQARDPEVYHHKWLFVAEDYEGFDVQESMRRSAQWVQLDGIDRKKIGRKSYWEQHVVPQIEARTAAD